MPKKTRISSSRPSSQTLSLEAEKELVDEEETYGLTEKGHFSSWLIEGGGDLKQFIQIARREAIALGLPWTTQWAYNLAGLCLYFDHVGSICGIRHINTLQKSVKEGRAMGDKREQASQFGKIVKDGYCDECRTKAHFLFCYSLSSGEIAEDEDEDVVEIWLCKGCLFKAIGMLTVAETERE